MFWVLTPQPWFKMQEKMFMAETKVKKNAPPWLPCVVNYYISEGLIEQHLLGCVYLGVVLI